MERHGTEIILSSAYLPPVEYFYYLNKYPVAYIDAEENYIKQTFRSRCTILAANGTLNLSIPVIKTFGNHTKIKDIRIDYSQPWQKIHQRSIESAYNSSPFFLYYFDAIKPFFEKKYDFLVDMNTGLLFTLLKLCNITCEINFTESYLEHDEGKIDLRRQISLKHSLETNLKYPHYQQVFADRHGFVPNLSIIDLQFNEGKFSKEYLEKIQG